jgi:hypothetical protein
MTVNAELARRLDVASLEQQVKTMYRDVALEPHGKFHFEMGRALWMGATAVLAAGQGRQAFSF